MAETPLVRVELGAGETHDAFLSLDAVRRLKRDTDLGPLGLMRSLRHDPDPDHVRLTLVEGLTGAGMDTDQAQRLALRFIQPPYPFRAACVNACLILDAFWNGVEAKEVEPGKEAAPQKT